jgi:hypothetical protein
MTGRRTSGQSKGWFDGALLLDKCNGPNALDLAHAFSKGWRATNCTTPELSRTLTE